MAAEHRCKHCGHPGRLKETRTFLTGRLDGYVCASTCTCIRRQEQAGQWIGTRVLHRRDLDGTCWTIRRRDDEWLLVSEFRDQRLTSHHATIDAAKAHAEEFIASIYARDVGAYRVDEPESEAMF